MKNSLAIGVAGILISAAMLGFGVYAGTPGVVAKPAAEPSSMPGRAAIEEIVRDYLVSNPEIMVEVQAALETRQEERQRAKQVETIQSERDKIFSSSQDGVRGNPQGTATLVEFFDYNCGYCKRSFPDLMTMILDDPNLRIVFKEFPILGADSQKAHIVSMAFRSLHADRWGEFHDTLMTSPGRADEASAIKVALALGADEAALRQAMRSPDIVAAINGTYQLADQLSITGTPSYVVGNEVVFGALGPAILSEKVALARACGDGKTC